ncbi:MAG: Outer rane efflux protein [Gemmataceae bacterium]|nr:Outer rane efflux protein [Gemmataceae bacterium]
MGIQHSHPVEVQSAPLAVDENDTNASPVRVTDRDNRPPEFRTGVSVWFEHGGRSARGSAMLMTVATAGRVHLFRVAAVLAVVLVFFHARGPGQQPAPVFPTVPPPRPLGQLRVAPHGLPGATATTQPGVEGEKANDEKEVAKDAGPELALGECIAIALERQPALKAVRASQQATSAGMHALNNIGRLGSLLSPDLPIRKEQSSRGVIAAAADVQKLHNEVVHDVTRLYYTVVYAHQQEQLAEEVVAQIELLVLAANKLLQSKQPGEMTRAKLDVMLLGQAKTRRLLATARAGEKQAYAALREVMGAQDEVFRVKDKELPVMSQNVKLTKEMVIEMTLCRRPELALAAAGADAFRLEVYAQGKIPFRRAVPTLGSGSDIHDKLLPSGSRDPEKEYRPEPIPPSMPPQVVGSKADRVARVMAFSQRADAVYEKVRNLMVLEAENTFYTFEKAAKRVEVGKEGFDAAKDLMDRVREGFDNPKAQKDQLLLGYGQAAEFQSEYVEAVYQYLLALAALERVTAGGIRPAFPGR